MPSDSPLFPLNSPHFPFPHLQVDVVVLTVNQGTLQVLTIKEGDELYGSRFVLPGAFVHARKPLEWTAQQILKRKAKLGGDVEVHPLGCFSEPERDPRGWVVSIPWLALVRPHELSGVTGDPRYLLNLKIEPMTKDAIPCLGENEARIGRDHGKIIRAAVAGLRERLGCSALAFRLVPEVFSLRQLQEVHEAILGYPVDRATFGKQMLGRTFTSDKRLVTTGEEERGSHRPAALFRLGHEYDGWRQD